MGGECKVFIGGLPPQTTQDSLASYLSQYGQITECKVVLDLITGRSKGYGFVAFSTPQEAQAAVAQGYLTVDGKKCNCNLACVGAKKDTLTKKRSFPEGAMPIGTELYPPVTGYENYDYSTPSLDKRQRIEPMMTNGGYVAVPIDMSQAQLNSSLNVIYTDIQNLKYEISNLSQSIAPLVSSLMAMKNGIDALCHKQGIVVAQPTTNL
jgi:hypothetical protein